MRLLSFLCSIRRLRIAHGARSARGPRGAPGAHGVRGPRGARGAPGAHGSHGARGARSARVVRVARVLTPAALIPAVCAAAAAGAATGCLESPGAEDASGGPRIVAKWDPLACGEPHRVALELDDEAGRRISSSAPCAAGGLTLEAPHFGVYAGRIYAWTAGRPIRSVMPVQIDVDEATERWTVATPE